MRCCPKCGSTLLMFRAGRGLCQRCGKNAIRKAFPHLHSQIDDSGDRGPVVSIGRGTCQRIPTHLDGGE